VCKELIGCGQRMYVGAQEGDDRLHKEMVACDQGTDRLCARN
jgi:hypothetical protein